MPRSVLVVVASVALGACHRSAPPPPAAVEMPDSPSAAPSSPVAVADAGPAGCAASPAGGVLVARSSTAPHAQAIAAGPGGVLVTWLETSPGHPCRGGGDICMPVNGHMRVFDSTLVPTGADGGPPPLPISLGTSVDSDMGLSPVALDSGGLYGAHCAASAVSSRLSCSFAQVAGPVLADSEWSFATNNSALVVNGGAAMGVGGTALLVVPSYGEMYLFASGTHARREFIAEGGPGATDRDTPAAQATTLGAPAIAPAGVDQAVAVWRGSAVSASIRGRLVGTDGHGRGHVVVLSAPGDDVGAPAVAWVGGAADVLYAHRRAHGEPWRLALARLTPGSPPVRTEIATGSAPAVAPGIVAQPGLDGCAIVTWTEGEGHGTVAKTGRLCPSSPTPSGVAQVSQAGIEAGAAPLATDGASVFTVWQEVPGHGAPVELRAARLTCAP